MEDSVWRIDCLGRATYLVMLLPYYGLLAVLILRYRVILAFTTWRVFILTAALLFGLLGLLFEWLAGVFHIWTFPPETHWITLPIPIFGWFTGHRVPLAELLWIAGVIPLFYFLYYWATSVFYDIIYVIDEQGRTYKTEYRWVGFFGATRILKRPKYRKGRENETALQTRVPGVVARTCMKASEDNHAD